MGRGASVFSVLLSGAVLLLLWPASVVAQPPDDDQPADEDQPAGEDTPEETYEPDQRGYEPDQRGEEDEGGDEDGIPDEEEGEGEEEDDRTREMRSVEQPASYGGVALASEDAAAEASGLGFWLNAGSGYSYLDLGRFDLDNFLPQGVDRRRHGSITWLGAGFRIGIFRFGMRGSFAVYADALRIGQIGFDTSVALATGPVEPYVRLGNGFAFLNGEDYEHPRRSEASITGIVTELGAGVTGQVGRRLTLGGGVDFGLLRFSRNAARCATPEECAADDVDLGAEGDSLGLRLDFYFLLGLRL